MKEGKSAIDYEKYAPRSVKVFAGFVAVFVLGANGMGLNLGAISQAYTAKIISDISSSQKQCPVKLDNSKIELRLKKVESLAHQKGKH